MLPVPETLALIFLPLAVYFYYVSIKEKTIKYAFISGILMIIIAATHQAALLCLVLIIIALTLIELLIYRNKGVFKNIIYILKTCHSSGVQQFTFQFL